jgi:transcriptional regulator with XRE-family HTH domain
MESPLWGMDKNIKYYYAQSALLQKKYLLFLKIYFIITIMNKVLLKSMVPIIGTILKRYREKLRKNQGEIAAGAGISISMLSQIERGVVSPSIDTLCGVCAALGIEISELFRRIAPETPVRLKRAGERLSTRRDGVLFEQLAVSMQSNLPAELFLLEVIPGKRVGLSGGGHEGVEMGYILEGTATLTIEGKEFSLEKGDSISFNATLPHSLINNGKKGFRALWAALPPHKDYLGQ